MNPHLISLADVLVAIAVRQLVNASSEQSSGPKNPMGLQEEDNAHAVNRNVRQPRCIAKPGDCRRHADIEGSKR